MVSQKGDTYLVAERRNRFTPRYGFFDTRLRGSPVALHGRRSGSGRAARFLPLPDLRSCARRPPERSRPVPWRVATWRGRAALFRALLAPGIVVVDERSRDLCC